MMNNRNRLITGYTRRYTFGSVTYIVKSVFSEVTEETDASALRLKDRFRQAMLQEQKLTEAPQTDKIISKATASACRKEINEAEA